MCWGEGGVDCAVNRIVCVPVRLNGRLHTDTARLRECID